MNIHDSKTYIEIQSGAIVFRAFGASIAFYCFLYIYESGCELKFGLKCVEILK